MINVELIELIASLVIKIGEFGLEALPKIIDACHPNHTVEQKQQIETQVKGRIKEIQLPPPKETDK